MVLIGASNLATANRLGFVVLSESRDERQRYRHFSQRNQLESKPHSIETSSRSISAKLPSDSHQDNAASKSHHSTKHHSLLMIFKMIVLALFSPLQSVLGRRSTERTKSSQRKRKSSAMAVRVLFVEEEDFQNCSSKRRNLHFYPQSISKMSRLILDVPTNGKHSTSNCSTISRALCPLLMLFKVIFLNLFRTKNGHGKMESWGKRADVALRRAMAIGRLASEEDEFKNCCSRREFSLFVTNRGDTLFTRSWTPTGTPIRGLVLIMHGLNEHSGRYDSFARRLNRSGLKAYAMDWTGHGGSDGLHGYVHSLDYAVEDAKLFLEKILEENPGLPCFCFGHSTGAAIILKAVLDPKVEVRLRGIVLTSPAIRVQPARRILAMVAPIASLLLPRHQLSTAQNAASVVSRNPAALAAKYSDPLVFTGSVRVRTGYEILRITSYLQRNLERINVPFMALHGAADTVTDPAATLQLHTAARSADKSVKLYDGLLHDLLFELEGDEIAEDIIDWIKARIETTM